VGAAHADPELFARLKAHRVLAGIPDDQIDWLVRHGRLERFEPDTVFVPKGSEVSDLYIVLSGRISIRVDRGAGPRKTMEWGPGDVTGTLPYSRMVTSPGDTLVEDALELFTIPAAEFKALTRDCYELTARLVHVMLDRTRYFTSSDLQDEKMLALGKLAAGLAHELNNPASAVVRSAKALAERLGETEASARALGAMDLSDVEVAAIQPVREACLQTAVRSVRSPIEEADREDAIVQWLDGHGADTGATEALAESTLSLDALDEMANVLNGPRLDAALRWVAADCSTRRLALEIETAAARIHTLVAAIKGFTYMDQANVPKPVDIARGLSDTIAVIGPKAKAKSVSVGVHVEPGLPAVDGYGGEMNQIWANLIDNAIDAAPPAGRVEVTAARAGANVAVSIVDNGPGIPPELRARIFEPFFTTKPVGQGTGLGLDIVWKLVRRHDGSIDVESQPGRTVFTVTMPISSPHAHPAAAESLDA